MEKIIEIHIKPNAPENKIIKQTDKYWKVAVTAKPINGAANLKLIKFLEKELKSKVEILRGKTSKKKLIRLSD